MKIEGFTLLEEEPGIANIWRSRTARVEVTTGFLWWRETRTRVIHRKYSGFWYFSDNGEICPIMRMEELERVWEATRGKPPLQID